MIKTEIIEYFSITPCNSFYMVLKKINHKGFVFTKKLHQSANSTAINIIGEIQLEIQIQGDKTIIVADVATNLVTDLLLGNDGIGENNVIIDSPQQQALVSGKIRF